MALFLAVSEFCRKQWSAVHLPSLFWNSHILIFTHTSYELSPHVKYWGYILTTPIYFECVIEVLQGFIFSTILRISVCLTYSVIYFLV